MKDERETERERDGFACRAKKCTDADAYVQNTPRSVYKGHAIRDIVLFWKKFKGQGHLRTTLLPNIKGHPHTVPLK